MKVVFEYSQGCRKHINQDVYGYKDHFFWVIDGATEVFANNYLSDSGDVYWVVQQLNKALLAGDTTVSLKEYVRNAISKVRYNALALVPTICEIPENRLPTYSICCASYADNSLEYLCLGDCSLFASNAPTIRYTDDRIYPFHLQVNKVKDQFRNDIEQYHSEVLKKVREIKQYINTESGYWIGTLNPDAVDHAICGKHKIESGDRFLICSDGFRPSIDEANMVLFKPSDIFRELELEQIIIQQNISEKDYFNKTGIDISDDKTVLLIQL